MTTFSLPVINYPITDVPPLVRSPFPIAERGRFIKQFSGPEEGTA